MIWWKNEDNRETLPGLNCKQQQATETISEERKKWRLKAK
jgi:hypothetical protein